MQKPEPVLSGSNQIGKMNEWLTGICAVSAAYAAIGFFLYRYIQWERREERLLFLQAALIFLALFLNLQLGSYSSFGDAGDFETMLRHLETKGFADIYAKGDIQYPPLFWYLYYGVSRVMLFLGVPVDARARAFVLGIKLPCILAEFLVLWLTAGCVRGGHRQGRQTLLCYVCLLNPGILFTTGFVCQVDMLYTAFLTVTVYLLMAGKLIPSYFSFAAAVLLKFQAVFLTPLVLLVSVQQVILQSFTWKRLRKELSGALVAVGTIFAAYIPMILTKSAGTGQAGFFDNFTNSIKGFGKASQNACNFWMLIGYNQVPIEEKFGPLSCQTWNICLIAAVTAITAILFIRRWKETDAYPLLAAFLTAGVYTFAVKMMSRYLYPVLFFLYLAYACRPGKARFRCAMAYSVLYILISGTDYLVYPWNVYERERIWPYAVSMAAIVCIVCLAYFIWKEERKEKKE